MNGYDKTDTFLANISNFPVVPVHQSLLSILGKILFFLMFIAYQQHVTLYFYLISEQETMTNVWTSATTLVFNETLSASLILDGYTVARGMGSSG